MPSKFPLYFSKFSVYFGVLLLILTACAPSTGGGAKIHVEDAWARPADISPTDATSTTPQTQKMPVMDMSDMPEMSGNETNSAVYFVIVNDGDAMDTLVGAASEAAASAEVHQTKIENDVAQMLPISHVDVPAHGRIEFKPLSYHMMLVGLKQDLKEGSSIKVTFIFEKSGEITLEVPIRQQ